MRTRSATVGQLDEGVAQTPGVDGNRLLDDVDQSCIAHLPGDEAGRPPLLGRPGDPEAERVRADRLESLHDVA